MRRREQTSRLMLPSTTIFWTCNNSLKSYLRYLAQRGANTLYYGSGNYDGVKLAFYYPNAEATAAADTLLRLRTLIC